MTTRVRRLFVAELGARAVGEVFDLDAQAAHHLLTVLRVQAPALVEAFDSTGNVATLELQPTGRVALKDLRREALGNTLVLAAPLLKGDRQDWLVEKCCELGVTTLLPLDCERAVITELSENKRERYERLILAACKQSGRNVPMLIAELTPLASLATGARVFLSPRAQRPLHDVLREHTAVTLIIGPEGGFTDAETGWLEASGAQAARLGRHVLRAETAALAAAAVAATVLSELHPQPP